MRTMTHLIAGGIAATTLVAGTAVTASAQSTTMKDKRADVVLYKSAADEGAGKVLNRAESIKSGVDVTSSTVKHSKKSLKVTIKVAQLTKTPILVQTEIRAKGSKKPYYATNFDSKNRVYVFDSSFSKMLCDVKLSRKTGKNGRLSFTIPRSCIKKPKSLTVRTGLASLPGGFEDETQPVHYDAISSSKVRSPSWTKWLKAS